MCLLDSIKKYRSTDSNKGNIVFIGDPLVGKTSLINLLTCRNKFTDNYLQTKCIRFINHNFLTYIDYPGFDSAYYHINPLKVIEAKNKLKNMNIDAAVIVYDISSINSYKNIEFWKNKAITEFGNNIDIIVVGNKSDYWNKKVFKDHLLISAKEATGIFIEKDYYSDSDLETEY